MDEGQLQSLLDEAGDLVAMGELEQATELYRRCTQEAPQCFEAWHSLGLALLRTGHPKEAIGASLMATTLQPNDLLAWTALSQAFVANGQIAEAEDAKGKARILSLGGRVQKD
jgi:predicted Zn-dependent protease